MIELNVNEIFRSIDGEVNQLHQGAPSVFVRLSGCNLNCRWCDTQHQQSFPIALAPLIDKIGSMRAHGDKVTITGGEPLLQREGLTQLGYALSEHDVHTTIETNGSLEVIPFDISRVRGHIYWVVDYKLPSSGMTEYMNPRVFTRLAPWDIVKFVIATEEDLYEALKVVDRYRFQSKVAVSPAISGLEDLAWARKVTQMVLKSEMNAILSIQLHKLLNLK